MFDLHFLGRGAAFNPLWGNTNAWFSRGDTLVFLDFGEATFEKAVRTLDLARQSRIIVILTHLHADHAGSLPSLCSYCSFVLGKKVEIIHPAPAVVEFLTVTGIDPSLYIWHRTLPKDVGFSAEPVPVQHASDMKCFGWVLRDEEETVYFSGDAATLPDPVREGFLSGRISKLWHDTAGHDSAFHCSYAHLAELIPEERRKDVFCMHFDADYVAAVRKLGFSVVETDA